MVEAQENRYRGGTRTMDTLGNGVDMDTLMMILRILGLLVDLDASIASDILDYDDEADTSESSKKSGA